MVVIKQKATIFYFGFFISNAISMDAIASNAQ